MGLDERLQRLRLLALDVDGVLTDGRITLTEDGQELKSFSARDGMGIAAWRRSGRLTALVTARSSKAVVRRAGELGIEEVCLGAKDKRKELVVIRERLGLSKEEVAFVGDDLQDLGALDEAGVAFSVRGCPQDVAQRVDYVTRTLPGEGAVREVIELVLRAQGCWDAVVESYTR